MAMIESQPEIHIPPDFDIGLNEDVVLKILNPISAGVYSIVVKATANRDPIAFKLLVPNPDATDELEEVVIMNYLSSQGMVEVIKPMLGVKIHFFDVGNRTFHGFGMELFPHPTLLGYVRSIPITGLSSPRDCLMHSVRCVAQIFAGMEDSQLQASPGFRSMLVGTSEIRNIYNAIIRTLMKMWKLGVIHADLHINNILYDQQEERYRIIDFGLAHAPPKNQQKKFLLGVAMDFARFTVSFVIAILYPSTYGVTGDRSSRDENLIRRSVLELTPLVLPLFDGTLPSTPEFMEVYQSFQHRHAIQVEDWRYPSPEKIREAFNFDFINWDSPDSRSMERMEAAARFSEAGPSSSFNEPDTIEPKDLRTSSKVLGPTGQKISSTASTFNQDVLLIFAFVFS